MPGDIDQILREIDREFSRVGLASWIFAEHKVRPALADLFAKRGVMLTGFSSEAVQYSKNGDEMQIDLLASGRHHVVAVAVLSRLTQSGVDKFMPKLSHFFDFFEEYRGRTLYGGVAGLSIDSGVDRFAYRKGLFVLAQSGENVRLLNDAKFRPRAYTHTV